MIPWPRRKSAKPKFFNLRRPRRRPEEPAGDFRLSPGGFAARGGMRGGSPVRRKRMLYTRSCCGNEKDKSMKRIFSLPLHAVFIGIYPILNLYASNIAFIPFADAVRSLAVTIGFAAFFLIGFRLISRSWQKAGFLCSLLFFMFFSFGHLANWLEPKGLPFDIPTFGWIWLALFLPFPLLILRMRSTEAPTLFMNAVSATILVFPLFTIVYTNADRSLGARSGAETLSQMRGEAQAEANMKDLPQSEKPDIYFMILDAYERADNLKEFYDYDNSFFINALEDRGFYVASSSRSNYLTTTYSLNTSMNLLYFHEFPSALFKQARYNLYTDYVSEFLRRQGYRVVVFDSGTGDSNYQYADEFVSSPSIQAARPPVNSFEQLLLQTTLGLVFFRGGSGGNGEVQADVFKASVNRELDVRRERIRYALAHVPDYTPQEGPFFVFAHIYLPHFPFLYGKGGTELQYHENTALYWYEVEPEQYVEYYGYQLDYLNQAVLRTIDAIQAGSARPFVIILQGDHGDEHYLDWDAPTTLGVNVRSAILNAIYYSDGSYGTLYPTMTPVNTFRVTFNHWFGTQYPLLADKTYFHKHPVSTPITEIPDFIESCARFGICLPTPPG
jgi:hypothetical protein